MMIAMAAMHGFSYVISFDCHENGQKLQIHLVPHSHDDVGWVKTEEEYYKGTHIAIQEFDISVKDVLDNVVESLQVNSKRTFIYVEMAFFSTWWKGQNTTVQETVRNLIKNKQLEFINGGWSMNDEGK